MVSVLMPVFNAGKYLHEALESIRRQTFVDWEMIAVDDGSTDGSGEILGHHAKHDSRIRVVSRPNTGIVGALNDGLQECRGRYVARMDADDISLPQRLERQVAHMEHHPDCVALGSWVTFIDPQGWKLFRWEMPHTHKAIVQDLLGGGMSGLVHPVVMFRAGTLKEVGGYREEFQWVEDVELYTRLASLGHLAILREHLLLYRQHDKSVNRTNRSAERERRRMQAINDFRFLHGLEPLQACEVTGTDRDARMRRQWVEWACQSGFAGTAWKHLVAWVGTRPVSTEGWAFLPRVVRTTLHRACRTN